MSLGLAPLEALCHRRLVTRRRISDWLSNGTFYVTAGLAIFCMVGVGWLAFRDQLLGTARFCFRFGSAGGEVAGEICRDNATSCDFERQNRCAKGDETWVSACERPDGERSPLSPCDPNAAAP
ncbi:MAG: hypothetical protein KC731_20950 [Myxococcales bacterium]|nr:hypothetical protein [Myxococcales bacterium]